MGYVLRKKFDRTNQVASPLAAAFGRRVALRRGDLEMTQDTLIKEVNAILGSDLGRSTASVWENGHAEPSITTIAAIARVLHTRPEYLAYGVSGSHTVVEAPPERPANRKLVVPEQVSMRKMVRREMRL